METTEQELMEATQGINYRTRKTVTVQSCGMECRLIITTFKRVMVLEIHQGGGRVSYMVPVHERKKALDRLARAMKHDPEPFLRAASEII